MTLPGHWSLALDDERIAWLTLDRRDATANSLSRDVIEQLEACLAEIERERPAES
jgi:3-hydroxyacyl-CoA dehydrogenase/enoyl-CoA hydratase/3-hydroxybutyryl-CoA epimerase